MKSKFDIIIIGSGMGGLICADVLGREGYKICVLEKNKQVGGSLQTYVRDKVIFDSGVHYLGGLGEGRSAKNQAENVMITDMVRHDMGRIAQTGSVTVPALFALEPYSTVLADDLNCPLSKFSQF